MGFGLSGSKHMRVGFEVLLAFGVRVLRFGLRFELLFVSVGLSGTAPIFCSIGHRPLVRDLPSTGQIDGFNLAMVDFIITFPHNQMRRGPYPETS